MLRPPSARALATLLPPLTTAGGGGRSTHLLLHRRHSNASGDAQPAAPRDASAYALQIDALFRERRNEEALRLWRAMIDEGIVPTPSAFRALSTGLCLCGKFDRACRILDEMAPMGVTPGDAHEHMIHVLCSAGRVAQACRLADDIVIKERELPGKVRTVLINALRKAGRAELAIKLLHSKIGIGYDRIGSAKRRVRFRSLLEG